MNEENMLSKALEPMIKELVKELVKESINSSLDKHDIEGKIKEAIQGVASGVGKVISISLDGSEPKKVGGLIHYRFEQLLKMVSTGVPVLMVGGAGTGKTHGALSVAKALDMNYHSLSIGMQTTKTDILGFVDANGIYRESGFYHSFKDGGIFLMDEVDAGNPNVLLQVNSSLSNGFCEFPNAEKVYAHEKFRFIATANTFGTGANSSFVGRNKLDASTLDRFASIEWGIDLDLEQSLTNNDAWLGYVLKARLWVQDNLENAAITPRSSMNGARLLEAGLLLDDVIDATVLKGFSDDARTSIIKAMKLPEAKIVKLKIEEPKEEVKDKTVSSFDW